MQQMIFFMQRAGLNVSWFEVALVPTILAILFFGGLREAGSSPSLRPTLANR